MKTLSIITIAVIIVISATSVGGFINKVNDNQQQPYLTITVSGLKENYTINEPIFFSITLKGYGTSCGDTKVILAKENDSQFTPQSWGYLPDCVSGPSMNNFKFNPISANTKINQTGNYLLTVTFDDRFEHQKTVVKRFSVIALGKQPLNKLSEKDCGQFYMVPSDNHYLFSETYPVLILKQNSIGCTKLTYTINYMYNDNRSSSPWPQMVFAEDTFHVGRYIYTSNGNTYSTSSHDVRGNFETRTIPNTIDLSKYPVGSKFTVTYVIQPLPNATGFYDYSIEEVPCDSYPLVVGYAADQVNSSDFSKGMVGMHNHSCFNGPYTISSVQVSDMDYKLVKFQ